MSGIFDQFRDHSLYLKTGISVAGQAKRFCATYHTNVAVENATEKSAGKSNPEIGCKADNEQGGNCAHAAHEEDGLTAYSVGEAAPEHARACFGKRECGDEDTRKERGTCLWDIVVLDKLDCVGQNRGKGNWLSDSNECYEDGQHGWRMESRAGDILLTKQKELSGRE